MLECVLCTLTIFLSATSGFLFDDCPAPAPCQCTSFAILCGDRNLSRIPIFHNTSLKMTRDWELHLYGNSISELKCNAFFNLQSFNNGQNIMMMLSRNTIRVDSFSMTAFHGIENNVTMLILEDNELTSIPYAIGQLKNLETLSLLNNPLTTIDQRIVLSIRHSLTDLSIPLKNVSNWPDVIQYLTKLHYFQIKEFSHAIPVDAFKGFRITLKAFKLHNNAIGCVWPTKFRALIHRHK